ALRAQQHADGVQRPALVDGPESPVKVGLLPRQTRSGRLQVARRLLDLRMVAVELEVQLGEHAVRVGDLLADQLELRGDVVYSRLEPLHLALQLRPLTADLLQTLAARLQL